ncbi:sgd1p, putative [Entamoeba invadens IP1]|uniref:Sgd1p, putative n=1 Tax=Entamoeba invadens IP1 TaxID=370355 RepID=A0A0A1TX56_ENTIV|nr:sgd1p, putative [Entamoeba invadens IP1]ELP85848.1 sgd1p, putative [Entamoeba invadens IP1]|eukprot:XP_004185194.1 sgd1p, putative [Entamoeba invadens IP1]
MSEVEVQKCVRGQLNRLSSSSLELITETMTSYFEQYPKAYVTDSIVSSTLQTVKKLGDTPDQILTISSLISTLCGTVSIGVCGSLLQALYSEELTISNSILVCGFYEFGIIDSTLIFDTVLKAIDEKKFDIVITIIQTVGSILRSEEPKALKETILKANAALTGHPLDSKEKFVLEILNDLKNNKITPKNVDLVDRLKRLVNAIWKKNGVAKGFTLRVTLLEILDKKNKWWEAGSANSEVTFSTLSTSQDQLGFPQNEDKSGDLQAKAREHHMNTEVRRAVFAAVMGAEDYVDGYQRILQLNLKGEAEREVVYVLMYCIGQSKSYNIYFTLIVEQLVQKTKGARYTLQLAFFDRIKDLDAYGPRAAINWGKLLGDMLAKDFLNLKIFKGIDFLNLTTIGTVFVRTALQTLLAAEDIQSVNHAFERLISVKDPEFLKVRKYIHLFLLKKMGKVQDLNLKARVEKRRLAIIKMLNSSVDSLM